MYIRKFVIPCSFQVQCFLIACWYVGNKVQETNTVLGRDYDADKTEHSFIWYLYECIHTHYGFINFHWKPVFCSCARPWNQMFNKVQFLLINEEHWEAFDETVSKTIFMPSRSKIRGHIVFVQSVVLSFWLKL